MSLDEFAKSQIRKLERKSAPMPRPGQCQIVTKVAARGVAGQAGVSAKDFLVATAGQPAAQMESRLYTLRAKEKNYTFYARQRHELIDLSVSGIDIGVLVELTTPAIRAAYNPKNMDPTALETLWAGRDFEALEQLSAASLKVSGDNRASPALLFHGAALYESGRIAPGMQEIAEYLAQHAQKWTMNFSGVARYYAARDLERMGREKDAEQMFASAWEYNASERMAELIEKATGKGPAKPPLPWLQKRFPVEYEYSTFDVEKPEPVSLRAALDGLSSDRLLAVCLLASYRSNGPYADFLLRWLNYATYFKDYFAGLHVLTVTTERHPGREYHYQREAAVRELDLPFHLLHEQDARVTQTIEPPGSPAIFLLDRAGTVVFQGHLDSVEVWDLLASVSGCA